MSLEIVQEVDRSVTYHLDRIQELGLKLLVETDFAKLKSLWSTFDRGSLNPIFDPDQSDLLPSNSFWLSCVSDGWCVAAASVRYYNFRSFKHAYATGRFMYTRQPTLPRGFSVSLEPATPDLSGRIAYGGAGYVNPIFRKKGAATSLIILGNLLAYRFFDPDWFMGDMFEEVVALGLANSYAYKHCQPLFTPEGLRVTGERQKYLVWSSAQDYLDEIVRRREDATRVSANEQR
jgi:hypothetical protein